jgi:hypothetical protein
MGLERASQDPLTKDPACLETSRELGLLLTPSGLIYGLAEGTDS